MTYKEAHQIALAFGSTLIKDDLAPEDTFDDEAHPAAKNMRLVGLYAKNCVEWFLTEQAANAFGLTLVPLYDTLGEDAMAFILQQTRLRCVVASFDCFNLLVRVLLDPETNKRKPNFFLKTVVLVDPENPEDARKVNADYKTAMEQGEQVGLTVLMWHEVVAKGTDTQKPAPPQRDWMNTICYTSGTTGLPKGVMLPQSVVTAVIIGACRGPVCSSGTFEVSAVSSANLSAPERRFFSPERSAPLLPSALSCARTLRMQHLHLQGGCHRCLQRRHGQITRRCQSAQAYYLRLSPETIQSNQR